MKKSSLIYLILCIVISSLYAQNDATKRHFITLGLNGGITIGHLSDNYKGDLGLDISYLYHVSKRFYFGGTTGTTNYIVREIENSPDRKNVKLMPIAASIRPSPFKLVIGGADVGYAFMINNSGTGGGFYLAQRLMYLFKQFKVYAGPRLIFLDEGLLSSVQIGVNYIF